jgi:hypothetical protein
LTYPQIYCAEIPDTAFPSLLLDKYLARLLGVTTDWVRSLADEILGFQRLGSYFRFCSKSVEQWLGSLEPLFEAESVAGLLNVRKSWVYANADQIRGVIRMGRYVRFRPTVIRQLLTGSEVVQ